MLIPFIVGIMWQWHLQIDVSIIVISLTGFTTAIVLFSFLPLAIQYYLKVLQGLLLQLLLASLGALVSWNQDIRHHENWYGHHYNDSSYIIATITEPIEEKNKTYKAIVSIDHISNTASVITTKGKLICYFSKDSVSRLLDYGDRVLIHKKLQLIRNQGNPGAFNYQEYASFQGLYHNVFLQQKDWIMLKGKNEEIFERFLIRSRRSILSILKKFCNEDKDALGIAEALLIGYTSDLDKDIIQAYSNTGVVHIIAISGMHLALIYMLLVMIFSRLPVIKRSKLIRVILILACLWLFSLLTGGSASVLRSAVMFSCITIGKNFIRKSTIYNSLAVSAFLLLWFDPCFLWDVGFQLSYLALIGIVMFQKPISGIVFIKNKWLNQVWQLIAISIAAQIFTFPICIYYFHQFPLLFLIANLIAVPLSSVILYFEIGLLTFSWVLIVATLLGTATSWLVIWMNKIIVIINSLSFAVWDQLPASIFSTALLYGTIIGLGEWLLNKRKQFLFVAILCILCFTADHAIKGWMQFQQNKIIVYNVSQHRSIDFISGHHFQFYGDSTMTADRSLQKFHLLPSRTLYQATRTSMPIEKFFHSGMFYQFCGKKIVIINSSVNFSSSIPPIAVDLIIISGNPKLSIASLAHVLKADLFVFDSSNSLWKIDKWKQECSGLHLPCYSVPEKGAFILDF